MDTAHDAWMTRIAAAFGTGADNFDRAMHALGLARSEPKGRELTARAAGLMFLVKSAGWVFAVQLVLFLGAVWMSL